MLHKFGNQTVDKTQHLHSVANVFSKVANKYDLMNDLMSLGLQKHWKKALVNWAYPRQDEVWLDLATGSGDIAMLLADTQKPKQVIGADPNAEMLEQASKRLTDYPQVKLVQCNAEQLDFADRSFTGVTCAFGLRNFTEPQLALAEIARVLEPGGRVLILEFIPPKDSGPISYLHKNYLLNVLPMLGKNVVNDEASYRYLAESIMNFAKPETIATWCEKANLTNPQWRIMASGAVMLFRAWKTW